MVLRTQPQPQTQVRAPGAVQGSGSSAVAVETLVQRTVDAFDRLQEVNPEGALKEGSALTAEQGKLTRSLSSQYGSCASNLTTH